ncbi:MAG: hypothetical protein REH79_03670 [Spiroplasma sp.]|nr:hypothetical protein [Spiroplasma sp.]
MPGIFRNKTILLKSNKNQCLTWTGLLEKDQENHQEPLELKFNNKEYYFYGSGIKKENIFAKTSWINYKSKLSSVNQQKIVDAFAKFTNQNEIYWQYVTLKLKFDILNKDFKNFNNKLTTEENFLTIENRESYKKLLQLNRKNEKLSQKVFKLNYEIENIANEENTKEKIKEYMNEINLLSKNLNAFVKTSQNLTEKEQNQDESLSNPLQEETKVILLKYNLNPTLIWAGTTQKRKENINGEPLILKIDDAIFYFYGDEIKESNKNIKTNKKLPYNWIYYKTRFNYLDQKNIFEKFEELSKQKTLYKQSVLLKLKIEFLMTAFYSFDEKTRCKLKVWELLYPVHRLTRDTTALINQVENYYKEPSEPDKVIDDIENKKAAAEQNVLEQKIKNYQQKIETLFDAWEEILKKSQTLTTKKTIDQQGNQTNHLTQEKIHQEIEEKISELQKTDADKIIDQEVKNLQENQLLIVNKKRKLADLEQEDLIGPSCSSSWTNKKMSHQQPSPQRNQTYHLTQEKIHQEIENKIIELQKADADKIIDQEVKNLQIFDQFLTTENVTGNESHCEEIELDFF